MRKELEDKLVERFPSFFNVNGSPQETLMCFGFECGKGWFDLLWNLCEKIESKLSGEEIKTFEVVQVKEKFAGLRFYVDSANTEVYKLINEAESKSYEICESCGKPSETRKYGGWLYNMCDSCWEKYKTKREQK